jgi:putative phosphoesterase
MLLTGEDAMAKLAIITDIHGNYAALKAVLDDIDRQGDIKHIYCLGDLVGIGHETNEVLACLSERNDVSYVMGNHDEAILRIAEGKEPGSSGEEREHHQWIASHLDPSFIPLLAQMPKKRESEYDGKKLLFVHYHLDHHQNFLPIDRQPSVEKLDEQYRYSHYDVVCFGHHHPLHHFRSDKRLYMNPGSLGCHTKPFAPYAVLHIDTAIHVTFRQVPYDPHHFLLAFEKKNVPAREFILRVFFGNQHLEKGQTS